ncbi:MAG TPA: phosphodiester glycosidase family protein [Nocardioides sp.]|nr:phosphodiester glycosidase family protein [Nocardioides sp.]
MRTFPTLLLACVLAAATPAATGTAGDPDRPAARDDRDPRGQQTSDGVRGEIAAPLPEWMRKPVRREVRNKWQVSPGVKAAIWDERDARGPVRYYLLTADLRRDGLQVDYANDGAVRRTAPLGQMLARSKQAVAGVNGDFFDIGDTGAPLGVGRDRQRGPLNGPRAGWNNAFFYDRHGHPQIDVLPMMPAVREHPKLVITNVNSPSVRPGGIGAYNRQWGLSSGYRITDGQSRDVRMVLIREGKVVQTSRRLPSQTPINGVMLVGRGAGAKALAKFRVGQAAHVRWRLEGTPRMAITGNKFLVQDGVIKVVDDREMHPRTAIGIDRDSKTLLFLVVDGRQRFSRGYTMVELAEKMIELGADEALNLDGGGSSTMMAKGRGGLLKVINSPSDGSQRSIANGIEINYRKPR